jgi:hypothetical protein
MTAKQILTTVASAIAMSLIGNVAQAQADCPKAGELKNFAQITAQADIFNGCDVTTEVSFVGVGSGGYYVFSAYELDGLTMFRVMPLGQPPSFSQLGALEAYSVVIEHKKADVVFSVKAGDTLRLRGTMDYRKANGYDTGIASRVFRAQSVEVVKK